MVTYNGTSITYDGVGNALNWRDGMSFTWQAGRRMASATTSSGTTVTYKYNQDGIRTQKTVGSTVVKYYLNDQGAIIGEKNGTYKILFLFDDNGNRIGFTRNGVTYYYVFNLQGDVVALTNSVGTIQAYYHYDAWGKLLSITNASGTEITSSTNVAVMNPIRYRGYYYDTETGLYYLQSRYYDPTVGRFVNADSVTAGVGGSVQGYNLYSYCFNDPVNMDDSAGNWPQWIKNAVKWVAQNVIKPVVKVAQNTLSKVNATYSQGINLSGTPSLLSFNLQGGVSIDTKGNVAVQGSFSGGVTTGSSGASITAYQSVSNAPSIRKLEGPGYQIGGSVGVPVYDVPVAAGGDFNIIPDSALGKTYFGVTRNVGLGTPGAEFHAEWGETATWNATRFNVFDVAEGIYIRIMEW